MSIKDNISNITNRINAACTKAGRNPDEVTLVAVSKTVGVDYINEAVGCGIKNLGENKVQEIMDKYTLVEGSPKWHMIGHLQTNKVKYIIDKVTMIHSVDSVKLLGEIDKRAKASGKTMDVLIEVNVGREQSKYGVYPEDLDQIMSEGQKFKNLTICGLMTVAPALGDKGKVRPYFKEMKNLFENAKQKYGSHIRYLSMGMTNDFEVAIEEGANIVRVGTGIFGPRNYSL